MPTDIEIAQSAHLRPIPEIAAKLSLIPEYGLSGAGYWNLMRPFPQNWLVLDSLFTIRETPLPAGLLRS